MVLILRLIIPVLYFSLELWEHEMAEDIAVS